MSFYLFILAFSFIFLGRGEWKATEVVLKRGVQWQTVTTITGPNNASGVVWALGVCFFNVLFVFLLTNQFFFLFYLGSI